MEGETDATDTATRRTSHEVLIDTGSDVLEGVLDVGPHSHGVVVFAHGSRGGRNSPRNRRLAGVLRETGIGTLLVDLRTPDEASGDARAPALRCSHDTLSERLVGVVHWLRNDPRSREHHVGLFGGREGGPVALWAAAAIPYTVRAVVSRSGRITQSADVLADVLAPTLLIVGEKDDPRVLAQNRRAADALCRSHLAVIAGAGCDFEEPGKLDAVAQLAADWFLRHLASE